MRQVDEHPEVVELGHDHPSEVAQPAGVDDIGAAVGPAGVPRVRQRQVPGAEPVEQAQDLERVEDLVPALHPDQRRDPALAVDPVDVVGGACEGGPVRVERLEAVDPLELLQRPCRQRRTRRGAGHPHRPELGTHPTRGEPDQVRLQGAGPGESEVERAGVQPRLVADLRDHVVVAVDQRRFGQQRPDAVVGTQAHLSPRGRRSPGHPVRRTGARIRPSAPCPAPSTAESTAWWRGRRGTGHRRAARW
ncbi:hypothetical protein Ae168Ps1_0120 [Pseudonocardia sp. Ae168_Ps1]|nr:hypothetical protein Ae168Ps1_0120 [Pseudonocardia sp. Ae168_Ps1]OLL88163.1 hypothetical protein Ae263Ps1_5218c [Pseudonocardia sp. Ae263_Ps1]